MICEYGCGSLAKFKMKNGKLCCESHYNKCPNIKKKNSEKHKGKISGTLGKPAWNKGLTKETSEHVKQQGISFSKSQKGRKGKSHSQKTKERLSELAKIHKLGGHTSKKRLYFKKNNGEIIFLQSSFEIKFAIILEELSIEWERPNPFIWIDENQESHRYYADFKINNIYIDTKNDYLAKVDKNKIERVRLQNKIDLRIVTEKYITKEYVSSLL